MREKKEDRGGEGMSPYPLLGMVVKLFPQKGYGFIKLDANQPLPADDDGKDWFFHATGVRGEGGKKGIPGPKVFDTLAQGDRVGFTPAKEKDGRKKAIGVTKV